MARIFISHSSRDHEAAGRIITWLRAQGFEEIFLDIDKDAGIQPGAEWERTLYREIARAHAVILIVTAHWHASRWCWSEFTQARALGKAIFPIIETPTGETLVAPDIQHLDLTLGRDEGLKQLARALDAIAREQHDFPWDTSRPPYPGLLAFQEDDAAIYFGRDDDVRRLIERLNARRVQGGARLVALLGASGSGKSSLLRAAAIPRLKRDKRNWIVLPPMRPRAHPLDEFASALAVALGGAQDWRALRDLLAGEASSRGIERPRARPAREGRRARCADPDPDRSVRGTVLGSPPGGSRSLSRVAVGGACRRHAVPRGGGAALRLSRPPAARRQAHRAVRGILAQADAARAHPGDRAGPGADRRPRGRGCAGHAGRPTTRDRGRAAAARFRAARASRTLRPQKRDADARRLSAARRRARSA